MDQKLLALACSRRGTHQDRTIGDSSIRTRTKAMGDVISRESKKNSSTKFGLRAGSLGRTPGGQLLDAPAQVGGCLLPCRRGMCVPGSGCQPVCR